VVADLPIAEPSLGALTERADAARNRKRILEATAALVADRGIEHVSMQDVAEAACVGTGTLYRRFGDRAGLALALLDEETRELQDAMIAGPPPLGPGAPAAERLEAFGHAYLEHLDRVADILVVGTAGREGSGPFQLYRTHLLILAREAAPGADAEYVAEALLAALTPGHFVHCRRGLGWPVERLTAGWSSLVRALCP
jgi:AcrR family transcriptional regulator